MAAEMKSDNTNGGQFISVERGGRKKKKCKSAINWKIKKWGNAMCAEGEIIPTGSHRRGRIAAAVVFVMDVYKSREMYKEMYADVLA